ncbi:MAG: hypothetical protein LC115_13475 [Bacteroidia bacterium]|nr:hypothetical protein [Bacteroidia bacterium]
MDGSVCAAKHKEQNYAAGVMSLNGWWLCEGGTFSRNIQENTELQIYEKVSIGDGSCRSCKTTC